MPTTVEQYRSLRQRVIASHLKITRLEAGMNLKNLSQRTGISSGRLKKFENGESSIPLFDLLLISDELMIPNRLYLDLAMKLSKLPSDKLRAIAEGLLEITY